MLPAGTRLSSYEVVSLIGAGGMGEVYRARDTKLNRDVAIKILPELFAVDPDRLARFEREARAVAALSHPNILAIHDYGRDGATAYAVMELLDGASLRDRLAAGSFPPRRVVEYGAQIARGLAAAHEKGIVHRDLKPENIFITSDGHVKILDFGLARVAAPLAGASLAATVTGAGTEAGIVLGTVGYMSPEQVRGGAVDHRSDIFSLGAVLYEMAAGARAFGGDSAVETMNAILKEEPPDLRIADDTMGGPLDRVIRHCLEKLPAERFQSARDLAFDLDALGTRSSASRARTETAATRRAHVSMSVPATALLVAAALATGAITARFLFRVDPRAAQQPRYTRLTYEKGTAWNGRFAPDGQTIVFGAAWDAKPVRTFLLRTERPGATALNLPDAQIFSISSTGELAIGLGYKIEGWMGEGTLARVPMFGGAPRAIVEHVRDADWTPDGSDLAIVRPVGGRERLEFPIDTPLYDTAGYISHIRFSPDGQHIAFADHPVFADDNGDVAVVDRAGKKTTLVSGLTGLRGLAWSPDGREVWFTANADPYAGDLLRAVTLSGKVRPVLALPTDGKLFDVAKDGRVLIEAETVIRHVEAKPADAAAPVDISVFDQSSGAVIAPDGHSVLISYEGNLGGTTYATYLRRLDQSEAVRLGDGSPYDLSPDGRWAVSLTFGTPTRILLLPLGAGHQRELPNPDKLIVVAARWLPEGKHLALVGGRRTEPMRGFVQDIDTGALRPFTEPGVQVVPTPIMALSPDGKLVSMTGPDGHMKIYPIAGGPPRNLPIGPGEYPIEWTADGRAMFISANSSVPHRVFRLDLATGRREPWLELAPSQIAGTRLSLVLLTRDGRSYVHTYSQLLSDLYVAEGVR